MRIMSPLLRSACVAAACLLAAPASAYDAGGESYHADSFGNLIVYSPSGYKRIVVGKGHLLAEYEAAQAETAPDVVYYDNHRQHRRDVRRCYYAPGMFKGRSYMYGLPDGVVPTPARRVCD
jgi:hypothetical protein